MNKKKSRTESAFTTASNAAPPETDEKDHSTKEIMLQESEEDVVKINPSNTELKQDKPVEPLQNSETTDVMNTTAAVATPSCEVEDAAMKINPAAADEEGTAGGPHELKQDSSTNEIGSVLQDSPCSTSPEASCCNTNNMSSCGKKSVVVLPDHLHNSSSTIAAACEDAGPRQGLVEMEGVSAGKVAERPFAPATTASSAKEEQLPEAAAEEEQLDSTEKAVQQPDDAKNFVVEDSTIAPDSMRTFANVAPGLPAVVEDDIGRAAAAGGATVATTSSSPAADETGPATAVVLPAAKETSLSGDFVSCGASDRSPEEEEPVDDSKEIKFEDAASEVETLCSGGRTTTTRPAQGYVELGNKNTPEDHAENKSSAEMSMYDVVASTNSASVASATVVSSAEKNNSDRSLVSTSSTSIIATSTTTTSPDVKKEASRDQQVDGPTPGSTGDDDCAGSSSIVMKAEQKENKEKLLKDEESVEVVVKEFHKIERVILPETPERADVSSVSSSWHHKKRRKSQSAPSQAITRVIIPDDDDGGKTSRRIGNAYTTMREAVLNGQDKHLAKCAFINRKRRKHTEHEVALVLHNQEAGAAPGGDATTASIDGVEILKQEQAKQSFDEMNQEFSAASGSIFSEQVEKSEEGIPVSRLMLKKTASHDFSSASTSSIVGVQEPEASGSAMDADEGNVNNNKTEADAAADSSDKAAALTFGVGQDQEVEHESLLTGISKIMSCEDVPATEVAENCIEMNADAISRSTTSGAVEEKDQQLSSASPLQKDSTSSGEKERLPDTMASSTRDAAAADEDAELHPKTSSETNNKGDNSSSKNHNRPSWNKGKNDHWKSCYNNSDHFNMKGRNNGRDQDWHRGGTTYVENSKSNYYFHKGGNKHGYNDYLHCGQGTKGMKQHEENDSTSRGRGYNYGHSPYSSYKGNNFHHPSSNYKGGKSFSTLANFPNVHYGRKSPSGPPKTDQEQEPTNTSGYGGKNSAQQGEHQHRNYRPTTTPRRGPYAHAKDHWDHYRVFGGKNYTYDHSCNHDGYYYNNYQSGRRGTPEDFYYWQRHKGGKANRGKGELNIFKGGGHEDYHGQLQPGADAEFAGDGGAWGGKGSGEKQQTEYVDNYWHTQYNNNQVAENQPDEVLLGFLRQQVDNYQHHTGAGVAMQNVEQREEQQQTSSDLQPNISSAQMKQDHATVPPLEHILADALTQAGFGAGTGALSEEKSCAVVTETVNNTLGSADNLAGSSVGVASPGAAPAREWWR
ncbi:unnamed protein product [Amoebophrya sp. A120]|nr:unnamed protein product [Amoebophrya sp. A120]|eukprot:GSA120T00007976001.1